MATGSPKIKVVVTGDATSFDRAMKGAARNINGFGGSLRRVFNERVIGGALNLASDAIRSAFDFAQTGLDQFDALGDALAIVDANAKGMAATLDKIDLSKLGFDKVETAVAAEDITATAKALGLTAKETKKLTPALLKGAAAYSSLTGSDAKKSGDLFAKALAGNAKAAKELGVQFTKGMTPAQRVAAIMAKWGPLADDAANGTRSLADEQATLDAQMSNLSTSVGGFLDTALQPLVAGIVNDLIPALQSFWQENGPAILDVLGRIGDVVGTVAGFIANELVPVLLELWGAFAEKVLPKLLAFWSLIAERLTPVLQTLWNWFKTDAVPFLVNTLFPVLGTLLDWFTKIADFVLGTLAGAFDVVSDAIGGVAKAISDAIGFANDLIGKITSAPIIGDFLKFVSGNGRNAPAAFAPAAVSSAGGGRLGRMATPFASGAASGGVNVTIQTGVGDPVAIGREVARVLKAYRDRGGTL